MAKTHFFTSVFICIPALLVLSLIGSLSSCNSTRNPEDFSTTFSVDSLAGHSYAAGFDLIREKDFQKLHIYRHHNGGADTISYLLCAENQEQPEEFKNYHRINVPVRKIALLHTPYYSYFKVCDAAENIAAMSEAKYLYDQEMYDKVQAGLVPQVSFGESLNKEKLLELGVGLVINVGFPDAPNKELDFLESLGIPVLVFSEWQEPHPLGRAEWVRIIGAITGTQSQADEHFRNTVSEYEKLRKLASSSTNKPEVICNLPYKGIWYLPGGNSYMGNLLADAGASYAWKENRDAGGIQQSFEVVYEKGLEAPFWINPGFSQNIEEVLNNDERLVDFRSVKEGNVFNSTNRLMRGEANDYWESGLVNPHFILADLIQIFHPELQPDYTLYYFKPIR